MRIDDLSTLETSSLEAELSGGKKAVFYEELAEYSLRYLNRPHEPMQVEDEVRMHIVNLVYLTLYFDVVLIQTSALFNLNDKFVMRVVQRTLSHQRFQEMLRSGVVKIIGWGGRTPAEMFRAAYEFSAPVTQEVFADLNYLSNVKRLFKGNHVLYRAEEIPDVENDDSFRSVFEDSQLSTNRRLVDSVEQAILQSEGLLGQLTLVGFKPSIEKSVTNETELSAVYDLFHRSWLQHIDSTIPNVFTYLPSLAPFALTHRIRVGDTTVHSFLYSPAIFGTFFNRHFKVEELNVILRKPFHSLFGLRNGDWSRFRDAYHDAIVGVSSGLSSLDLVGNPPFNARDLELWSEKISEALQERSSEIDVNTYLHSIASISGALAGIPVAGSVVRAFVSVFGKSLSVRFDEITRTSGIEVSAYITKVRSNMLTQNSLS